MSIPQPKRAERGMIARAVAALNEPRSVVELRILNTRRGTVSGFFDDFDKLADEAARWSGKAPGIYMTLNPVRTDLLSRAANRLVEFAKHSTSDTDVLRRRWLPIDFDPVRPSGISSTDEEHQAALGRASDCRKYLLSCGWPEPVCADSGNGAHMLYRIDLPNDRDATALVARVLQAVSLMFTDDVVAVDTGVANAARIWKVYGTLAAKGDYTPERPHRLARLLNVPPAVEVVAPELLESLAAALPVQPSTSQAREPQRGGGFDLAAWIAEHALPVVADLPWQGGHKWVLNPCPWDNSHNNRAAFVVQFPNGAIAAGCHHAGCQGRDWHALRDLYEPGWRETRALRPTGKPATTSEPSEKTVAPVRVRVVADIEPETTEWLWEGRIPVGKISIIDGDPGLGKSALTLDLAARLSSGNELPGDDLPRSPVTVLLLSAEDGPADTIRPRLEAAGADLRRCILLDGIELGDGVTVPLVFPDHLDRLMETIIMHDARLVVVDPLMAFLSGRVDSHRDQDIRVVLARLSAIAQQTGAAVVLVRHLNKVGSGKALYRGGGSIGIVGAARSAMLVGCDPNDPDQRVIAGTKSNLGPRPDSLTFRLTSDPTGTVRIQWGDPTGLSADDLLGAPRVGAVDEAVDWLRDFLADGPKPQRDVLRAAEARGVSTASLRRARTTLGIKPERTGFGADGRWTWALPAIDAQTDAIDAQVPTNTHEHLWTDSHRCSSEDMSTFGENPIDAQPRTKSDEHLCPDDHRRSPGDLSTFGKRETGAHASACPTCGAPTPAVGAYCPAHDPFRDGKHGT